MRTTSRFTILLSCFCFLLFGINVHCEHLALPQHDLAYSFTTAPYVHPRIIQDLTTWLSDTGDQVVAINLLDAQGSNRYYGKFQVKEVEGEHSLVIYRRGKEMFAYQFIGETTNGIHVLRTLYSGGGSGTFNRLLLVIIERDMGLDTDLEDGSVQFNRPRLLLKKIGGIGLGDRWDGELRVEGNRLFIGKDTGWFGPRGDNSGLRLAGWHDLEAYGRN